MAQFLFVLYDDPSADSELSPAEIQSIIAEYSAWAQEMGAQGKHLGGNKLTDDGGRTLRPSESEILVSDGPYAEAKEVLGGYFLIEAADYDEAVALARECPHVRFGSRLDVRQIHEMDEPTA